MKHILIFLLLLTPLFAQVTPDSDYTIVRIKIIPEQVTIKTGERIHFQFIGLDARGFEVPAAFQWQYSGGTLTWNGYYTAGSRPGDYEIVATLPTTGISAKAKIKIISDQPELVQRKLMRLEIIPNKITLQPNQKMIFQMAAYDNYGDPMGVAMGIRFSGGNVVLADGPGQVEYTAGEQPGEYYLEVSTKEGITNRAHIIIQDKNTSNQQVQNYDNAIDRYKNQNTRTYVGENQREINEQNRDYEHARYSDRDYNRDRQNIQDYEQKQYENRYSSSTQYSSSQPIKRHIFIEPKWVSLMPNQTCKFTVKITDQYNKIISTQYGIEVEGGDLKEDGATFTAGDVPGEYKFVVTLPTGESEFAEIQIRRDPNAPEDSCLFRCTKETEPVYIEITPYDVQLSPNE
ncbi:MAG TPA: hypothetical protein PLR86_09735, partial [Planctomycetota bacterium]|nr:hypothetical protein [Planctomycetota bacterium]